MTATNFRDLLAGWLDGRTLPGRMDEAYADDILDLPVPWANCPTCKGEGVEFAGDEDDIGDGCPACTGTGKATVAQFLAWGSAVARDPDIPKMKYRLQDKAVDGYRNRILGVQP